MTSKSGSTSPRASSKKSPRGDGDNSLKKDKSKKITGLEFVLGPDCELSKEPRPFNSDLFGRQACRGFAKLFDTGQISDITLVLREEKIKAHRAVLGIWSDHFRAMLEHDRWKESNLTELPVEIDEHEIDSFKLMLRYMYTGETDFIASDNIISIISLSNYYGVHSLKEKCAEILGMLISDDSLLYFLKICDRYDCKKLEEACGEHLAEHFEEMIDADKLNGLEPSIWAEMLKSDDLQINSEEKLFDCVLKYCEQFKGDEGKRVAALELLLPHIRFPLFSPTYLIDKVEQEESIKDLKIVHELVHEALKFKALPTAVSNTRTKPRKGFCFDPVNSSPGIIAISSDGLLASLVSQAGWYSARTTLPLLPGNDYVEFKVEGGVVGGVNIMIGLALATCPLNGYAGQNASGWQYYTNGQIYHAGATPSQGTAYTVGDIIGVHMDYTAGRIVWYKNGTQVVTLAGVQKNLDQPMYPIVSLSAVGNSVSVKPRGLRPMN